MKLLSDDKLREMLLKAYQLGQQHEQDVEETLRMTESNRAGAHRRKRLLANANDEFTNMIAESAQQ